MSEQATGLRFAGGGIGRRARFMAAGGVLGLAVGVSLGVTQPPHLTSTALVLLPVTVGEQRSATDIDAQVRIAGSDSVLAKAGMAVSPALSARDMQGRVDVSSPTAQLVQISVWAPLGREAMALAAATTDAYLDQVTPAVSADTLAGPPATVIQEATTPVQRHHWAVIPLSLWLVGGIAVGMLLSLRRARTIVARTTTGPG